MYRLGIKGVVDHVFMSVEYYVRYHNGMIWSGATFTIFNAPVVSCNYKSALTDCVGSSPSEAAGLRHGLLQSQVCASFQVKF